MSGRRGGKSSSRGGSRNNSPAVASSRGRSTSSGTSSRGRSPASNVVSPRGRGRGGGGGRGRGRAKSLTPAGRKTGTSESYQSPLSVKNMKLLERGTSGKNIPGWGHIKSSKAADDKASVASSRSLASSTKTKQNTGIDTTEKRPRGRPKNKPVTATKKAAKLLVALKSKGKKNRRMKSKEAGKVVALKKNRAPRKKIDITQRKRLKPGPKKGHKANAVRQMKKGLQGKVVLGKADPLQSKVMKAKVKPAATTEDQVETVTSTTELSESKVPKSESEISPAESGSVQSGVTEKSEPAIISVLQTTIAMRQKLAREKPAWHASDSDDGSKGKSGKGAKRTNLFEQFMPAKSNEGEPEVAPTREEAVNVTEEKTEPPQPAVSDLDKPSVKVVRPQHSKAVHIDKWATKKKTLKVTSTFKASDRAKPRKVGRTPKSQLMAVTATLHQTSIDDFSKGAKKSDDAPVKRRPGRPPRQPSLASPTPTPQSKTPDSAPMKRGRGRPPKELSTDTDVTSVSDSTVSDEAPVKRGPGRPYKNETTRKAEPVTQSHSSTVDGQVKRRPGRPPKHLSPGWSAKNALVKAKAALKNHSPKLKNKTSLAEHGNIDHSYVPKKLGRPFKIRKGPEGNLQMTAIRAEVNRELEKSRKHEILNKARGRGRPKGSTNKSHSILLSRKKHRPVHSLGMKLSTHSQSSVGVQDAPQRKAGRPRKNKTSTSVKNPRKSNPVHMTVASSGQLVTSKGVTKTSLIPDQADTEGNTGVNTMTVGNQVKRKVKMRKRKSMWERGVIKKPTLKNVVKRSAKDSESSVQTTDDGVMGPSDTSVSDALTSKTDAPTSTVKTERKGKFIVKSRLTWKKTVGLDVSKTSSGAMLSASAEPVPDVNHSQIKLEHSPTQASCVYFRSSVGDNREILPAAPAYPKVKRRTKKRSSWQRGIIKKPKVAKKVLEESETSDGVSDSEETKSISSSVVDIASATDDINNENRHSGHQYTEYDCTECTKTEVNQQETKRNIPEQRRIETQQHPSQTNIPRLKDSENTISNICSVQSSTTELACSSNHTPLQESADCKNCINTSQIDNHIESAKDDIVPEDKITNNNKQTDAIKVKSGEAVNGSLSDNVNSHDKKKAISIQQIGYDDRVMAITTLCSEGDTAPKSDLPIQTGATEKTSLKYLTERSPPGIYSSDSRMETKINSVDGKETCSSGDIDCTESRNSARSRVVTDNDDEAQISVPQTPIESSNSHGTKAADLNLVEKCSKGGAEANGKSDVETAKIKDNTSDRSPSSECALDGNVVSDLEGIKEKIVKPREEISVHGQAIQEELSNTTLTSSKVIKTVECGPAASDSLSIATTGIVMAKVETSELAINKSAVSEADAKIIENKSLEVSGDSENSTDGKIDAVCDQTSVEAKHTNTNISIETDGSLLGIENKGNDSVNKNLQSAKQQNAVGEARAATEEPMCVNRKVKPELVDDLKMVSNSDATSAQDKLVDVPNITAVSDLETLVPKSLSLITGLKKGKRRNEIDLLGDVDGPPSRKRQKIKSRLLNLEKKLKQAKNVPEIHAEKPKKSRRKARLNVGKITLDVANAIEEANLLASECGGSKGMNRQEESGVRSAKPNSPSSTSSFAEASGKRMKTRGKKNRYWYLFAKRSRMHMFTNPAGSDVPTDLDFIQHNDIQKPAVRKRAKKPCLKYKLKSSQSNRGLPDRVVEKLDDLTPVAGTDDSHSISPVPEEHQTVTEVACQESAATPDLTETVKPCKVVLIDILQCLDMVTSHQSPKSPSQRNTSSGQSSDSDDNSSEGTVDYEVEQPDIAEDHTNASATESGDAVSSSVVDDKTDSLDSAPALPDHVSLSGEVESTVRADERKKPTRRKRNTIEHRKLKKPKMSDVTPTAEEQFNCFSKNAETTSIPTAFVKPNPLTQPISATLTGAATFTEADQKSEQNPAVSETVIAITSQVATAVLLSTESPSLPNRSKAKPKGMKRTARKQSDTSVAKFKCLHCTYTCNARSVMQEHIYNHTNVIPYSCGHCNAIFGTRSGVMVHTKRDHKGQPYNIVKTGSIREEEFYTSISPAEKRQKISPISDTNDLALQRDVSIKKIDAEKPPPSLEGEGNGIAVNKKKSRVSSSVDVTDLAKRLFQCRHCTFATNEKQSIQAHVKRFHEADRRYVCPLCDLAYCKHAEAMSRHFRKWHPGTPVILQFEADYFDLSQQKTLGQTLAATRSTGSLLKPAISSQPSQVSRPPWAVGCGSAQGLTKVPTLVPQVQTALPSSTTSPPTALAAPTIQTSLSSISAAVNCKKRSRPSPAGAIVQQMSPIGVQVVSTGHALHNSASKPAVSPIILKVPHISRSPSLSPSVASSSNPDDSRRELPEPPTVVQKPGPDTEKPAGECSRGSSVERTGESSAPINQVNTADNDNLVDKEPSAAVSEECDVSKQQPVPDDNISSPQIHTESDQTVDDDKNWKTVAMELWKVAANHRNAALVQVQDSAPFDDADDRPVDLTSIRENLENGVITSLSAFEVELQLMYTNTLLRMRNQGNSESYKLIEDMCNEVTQKIEQTVEATNSPEAEETQEPLLDTEKPKDSGTEDVNSQTKDAAATKAQLKDRSTAGEQTVDKAGSRLNRIAQGLQLAAVESVHCESRTAAGITPVQNGIAKDRRKRVKDVALKRALAGEPVPMKSVACSSPRRTAEVNNETSVTKHPMNKLSNDTEIEQTDPPMEVQSNETDADDPPFKIVSVRSLAQQEEPPVPSDTTMKMIHECRLCDKRADQLQDMIDHIDTVHSLDFWYACPYCPFGCSRHKSNMTRHIKRSHPNQSDQVQIGIVEQHKYFTTKEIEVFETDNSTSTPDVVSSNTACNSHVGASEADTALSTTTLISAQAHTPGDKPPPPSSVDKLNDLSNKISRLVSDRRVNPPVGSAAASAKSVTDPSNDCIQNTESTTQHSILVEALNTTSQPTHSNLSNQSTSRTNSPNVNPLVPPQISQPGTVSHTIQHSAHNQITSQSGRQVTLNQVAFQHVRAPLKQPSLKQNQTSAHNPAASIQSRPAMLNQSPSKPIISGSFNHASLYSKPAALRHTMLQQTRPSRPNLGQNVRSPSPNQASLQYTRSSLVNPQQVSSQNATQGSTRIIPVSMVQIVDAEEDEVVFVGAEPGKRRKVLAAARSEANQQHAVRSSSAGSVSTIQQQRPPRDDQDLNMDCENVVDGFLRQHDIVIEEGESVITHTISPSLVNEIISNEPLDMSTQFRSKIDDLARTQKQSSRTANIITSAVRQPIMATSSNVGNTAGALSNQVSASQQLVDKQTILRRPPSIMPARLAGHRMHGVGRPVVSGISGNTVTTSARAPPRLQPPPLIPMGILESPQVTGRATAKVPPLIRAPINRAAAISVGSAPSSSRPQILNTVTSPGVSLVRAQSNQPQPRGMIRFPSSKPALLVQQPRSMVSATRNFLPTSSASPKGTREEEVAPEAFRVFNLAPRAAAGQSLQVSPASMGAAGPAVRSSINKWLQFQARRLPVPNVRAPFSTVSAAQTAVHVPTARDQMLQRMAAPSSGPAMRAAVIPGPGKLYSCSFCRFTCSSQDILQNHILSHGTEIRWTCPYCPMPTQMAKAVVEKHIKNCHPGFDVVYIPARLR